MRKKALFVLSVLLLASCGSQAVWPEELGNYLNACSYENARKETRSLSSSFSSVITKADDETSLLGSYSYSIQAELEDRISIIKTNFSQGSQVYYDALPGFYVTYSKVTLTYHEEDTLYYEEAHYEGYQNDQLSGELLTYDAPSNRYGSNQISPKIDELFFNQTQSGYRLGGLYYADMFKLRPNLAPACSLLEDQTFRYYIHDVQINDEKGKGTMNMEILMNSLGLLSSLEESAINETTNQKVVTKQNVTYNT